jgi:hypothetical protein
LDLRLRFTFPLNQIDEPPNQGTQSIRALSKVEKTRQTKGKERDI